MSTLVLQGSMCVRLFICLDLNNWRWIRDGLKEDDREGVNGQNFIVARFAEFKISRRHSSRIDAGLLHWRIQKDFPIWYSLLRLPRVDGEKMMFKRQEFRVQGKIEISVRILLFLDMVTREDMYQTRANNVRSN